ncbi:hypothetical protein H6F77_22280 [Microcoleus sp. FACHB-831]|uniref:hypothetical protein n=1 Tax=Microcoleus sp. FACHB-831 TaxID=2692827 RepID=UPI001683500F|nr:hypothetical protein [Microcoleus sp. FACHB-831]MBD1923772.1 hypothetical protein [Microcoleus sp. FACHB-831]
MDLITYLACIKMAIGFVTSYNMMANPSNSTTLAPVVNVQAQNNLTNIESDRASITVKFFASSVADPKVSSYAKIILNINNNSKKPTETEITRLVVVDADDNKVLMSSTPQELGVPAKISLQPGISKEGIKYFLKSESDLYQPGHKPLALIYYRQDGAAERVIITEPEFVAVRVIDRINRELFDRINKK